MFIICEFEEGSFLLWTLFLILLRIKKKHMFSFSFLFAVVMLI